MALRIRPYNAAQATQSPEVLVPRSKPEAAAAQETFGRRLARLRKEAGYTQQQLAEKLGISRRMLAYYEGQSQRPPAALLPRIAEVLSVPIDVLFGVQPLPAPAEQSQDRQSRRLWKKFQQIQTLPERDQRAIIRVINSFIATRGQSKLAARRQG